MHAEKRRRRKARARGLAAWCMTDRGPDYGKIWKRVHQGGDEPLGAMGTSVCEWNWVATCLRRAAQITAMRKTRDRTKRPYNKARALKRKNQREAKALVRAGFN